jgi:hypothetical protein
MSVAILEILAQVVRNCLAAAARLRDTVRNSNIPKLPSSEFRKEHISRKKFSCSQKTRILGVSGF